MKRFAKVALTGLAMLLMAAVAAMLSLRLAIHGREVAVPNLAGLSDSDAAAAARKLGLNLSVENRFYSAAVPANHVLSQAPATGERVRRGWQVRVTESLGAQHVAAPDLKGEIERPALLMLSHLQLELAPEAHLPAAGPPGIVLAQSPSPRTADATGPRVALLVSGPEADPAAFAYVMPRIIGMSIASAADLLATAGLHLASAADPNAPAAEDAPARKIGLHAARNPDGAEPATHSADVRSAVSPTRTTLQAPATTQIAGSSKTDDSVKRNPASAGTPGVGPTHPSINPGAIIATQYPQPGNRVTRADAIRVTTAHAASDVAAPPP